MSKAFAALFCLVFFSTSVSAQMLEAPMRRGELGHYIVELTVNGEGPYNFVIDTAASLTMLSQGFVEELGLSPVPGASGMAHGANGNIQLEYFDLETVGFGNGELEDMRTIVQTSGNWPDFKEDIHGVLGVDVIGNYIPAFLQSGDLFRLVPSDMNVLAHLSGWTQAPLGRGFGGVRFIEVDVNGTSIDALFDTGASRSVMNFEGASAAGYTHGDPRVGPADRPVNGLGGEPMDAVQVSDATVVWGEHSASSQLIVFADLPIFNVFRMDGPAMIAGATLFQNRDFVVDYQQSVVLFAPDAE